MKISSKQNIFFQKKLMANCAIKGTKGAIPCSIYKIEDKDRDYFIHLINKPGWKNYLYATIMDGDIRRGNAEDMYVIEDKKNNCLGFAQVASRNKEKNLLEFLEVKPVCRAKNEKRSKQYVGETLLSFLTQITKKSGKDMFCVPHADPSAFVFYGKCFFAPSDTSRSFVLTKCDMDKLIEQNYEHTGQNIDFMT